MKKQGNSKWFKAGKADALAGRPRDYETQAKHLNQYLNGYREGRAEVLSIKFTAADR